ncbi:MAG: hypothetical protein V1780_01610 [Chloroflexota bacterium]
MRRHHLGLLQLAIIIGLLALIWLSFGQNVLAPPPPAAVPGAGPSRSPSPAAKTS